MSELSQQNLRALGLVETNVVRMDEALKALHRAVMQMDLDQMRIFSRSDISQKVYAAVNAYAGMDEGLHTVDAPFYQSPKESAGLACDGCGATKDDYGLPFNAKLSVNKPHRSLCVSALGCTGTLRLSTAQSVVTPSSASSFHFQHFADSQAACDYIIRELLDTLRDDLDKMEGTEAEHYTDEDRSTMRLRIADIELVEPFIGVVLQQA